MPDQSLKRTVAKFMARQIVWSVVANATSNVVKRHVDIEDDTLQSEAVDLGACVVGFAMSRKLQPQTDEIVDRIANWRRERKETQEVIPAAA